MTVAAHPLAATTHAVTIGTMTAPPEGAEIGTMSPTIKTTTGDPAEIATTTGGIEMTDEIETTTATGAARREMIVTIVGTGEIATTIGTVTVGVVTIETIETEIATGEMTVIETRVVAGVHPATTIAGVETGIGMMTGIETAVMIGAAAARGEEIVTRTTDRSAGAREPGSREGGTPPTR
jgi:hypothetical protein